MRDCVRCPYLKVEDWATRWAARCMRPVPGSPFFNGRVVEISKTGKFIKITAPAWCGSGKEYDDGDIQKIQEAPGGAEKGA